MLAGRDASDQFGSLQKTDYLRGLFSMALNFLISGTDVRVGKTMVGCALAFAFKVRAMRVGVMKPVQTGCPEREGMLVPEDGQSLVAAASADLRLDLVSLYRYRSALAPAAAAEVDGAAVPDFAAIERAYREIAARSDAMIVEDAGGLAAPIDWRQNYADLASALNLEIILVVASRPGCINAAALTIDYAARRNIAVRGIILNAIDADASATVEREAELIVRATGTPCLGTVRCKEPLSQRIVEGLL
jgi:dethiobiotin synthetase